MQGTECEGSVKHCMAVYQQGGRGRLGVKHAPSEKGCLGFHGCIVEDMEGGGAISAHGTMHLGGGGAHDTAACGPREARLSERVQHRWGTRSYAWSGSGSMPLFWSSPQTLRARPFRKMRGEGALAR